MGQAGMNFFSLNRRADGAATTDYDGFSALPRRVTISRRIPF